MSVFHRKLCALLKDNRDEDNGEGQKLCDALTCLDTEEGKAAREWWRNNKEAIKAIASSSDRVNLKLNLKLNNENKTLVKHPISGQEQTIQVKNIAIAIPDRIKSETDAKTVFWWCWRFVPELRQKQYPHALLKPQHAILPDCPEHSYHATVSALAGAIDFDEQGNVMRYPYILLFTFSPVQEFIKASRKFLDFWAGSYLLHYLSAKLCWHIAETYGADTVITPSLWSQEIIDALLLKQYPEFSADFREYSPDKQDPQSRFQKGLSTSLATAGFPNTIVVLVDGKEKAKELGEKLSEKLHEEWRIIADNVREGIQDHPIPEIQQGIREGFIDFLESVEIDKEKPKKEGNNQKKIDEILDEFEKQGGHDEQNRHDLKKWGEKSCWQWRKLWQAQIDHTWQPYWTAVPLGNPDDNLSVNEDQNYEFKQKWLDNQEEIAKTRAKTPPPTEAEKLIYKTLNDGTWWGSIQARCAQAMQGLKNARTWTIPISPGVRSTLSGQLSALHPQFAYGTQVDRNGKIRDFRDGYGLSMESMRLFWRVMAEVYPGLFDGSEMMNAIELTKRMSWSYGGVAESLGIGLGLEENTKKISPITFKLEVDADLEAVTEIPQGTILDPDYNQLILFPNLTSIAAARFAYRDWQNSPKQRKLSQYWSILNKAIANDNKLNHNRFAARTRARPFHIAKTDRQINPSDRNGSNYNGVMFSSKWLADDMNLDREKSDRLRPLVEDAHKKAGFGEGSPSDWWVIVLGDGDGMGQYVSGSKLHPYEKYLTETNPEELLNADRDRFRNDPEKRQDFITAFRDGKDSLLKTRKRMGPATHVGLNRALLDFSNRLVPFITEKRFCGRVVYSGGDDVMAVLPLEDLPDYLLSLRAAWCGGGDPENEFSRGDRAEGSGYWIPKGIKELPDRPLFTMGNGATMSLGIVIAHKSVPLPAALDALWEAESDRAKEMRGRPREIQHDDPNYIPPKNGLCFRVLYSSGNCLEALMKGELFADWREWMKIETDNEKTKDPKIIEKKYQALSSLLYRLAEDLPKHAAFTPSDYLISKAAAAIVDRRDEKEKVQKNTKLLLQWLRNWEDWARSLYFEWEEKSKQDPNTPDPLGFDLKGLAKLLRFSAFWLDKMQQRQKWHDITSVTTSPSPVTVP